MPRSGSRRRRQFRDEMRIEVDETQRGLTIFECRQPGSELVGPEWTRMPIARFVYVKARNEWTLYCADRNGRFQRYWGAPPARRSGISLRRATPTRRASSGVGNTSCIRDTSALR